MYEVINKSDRNKKVHGNISLKIGHFRKGFRFMIYNVVGLCVIVLTKISQNVCFVFGQHQIKDVSRELNLKISSHIIVYNVQYFERMTVCVVIVLTDLIILGDGSW